MLNAIFKEPLKHYGVKGMQWGVRKKRNGGSDSKDYRTARALKGRSSRSLSNKEIQTLANRLDLEKRHSKVNPTISGRGKKAVSGVLSQYGNSVISGLIGAAAAASVALILKKAKG